MKNTRLLTLLLISWMSIEGMNAQEICCPEARSCCDWLPTDCCGVPLHSFLTIGGNYTRVNFKPHGEPSFNGNLGGAHAQYEYRPPNDFYAGIEFDWRQGSMSGSAGKRNLLDLNTTEKFGYTWVKNCYLFTLYSGFGFRFLGHHLHPSSFSSTFSGSFFPPFLSSTHSLRLNYFEFYFPLGFESKYSWNSWFTVGLNFEWMAQAFTTVYINPLKGAYWNLEQKFGNFLVELPFIFNLSKCNNWQVVLSPFYERWEDGHSTAKTSGGTPLGLPGNTYNFYGIDINLVYAF